MTDVANNTINAPQRTEQRSLDRIVQHPKGHRITLVLIALALFFALVFFLAENWNFAQLSILLGVLAALFQFWRFSWWKKHPRDSQHKDS